MCTTFSPKTPKELNSSLAVDLAPYVPNALRDLRNPQKAIPRIANNKRQTNAIEQAIRDIPTQHNLWLGDARKASVIGKESVHLVVTSPPYWNLKEYPVRNGQLGNFLSYSKFLGELDKVWSQCYRALVPGGRLVCIVGDVCVSRRKNNGRHTVIPLHSSIQEHCRGIGFDNLAPIVWHKIANAAYEVERGSRFLGKPYEPGAIIKNDIEFVLMERKPGGYRSPSISARVLSVISVENHNKWFQQIWTGISGASTRNHPAPFPLEVSERLIRMFSFVGDTVLDPFMGTGTTLVAAAKWGRNSIGFEIDSGYFDFAHDRLTKSTSSLFSSAMIQNGIVE